MNCKFCGAEVENGAEKCPACGCDQNLDIEIHSGDDDLVPEDKDVKKKGGWKFGLAIAGAVVGLLALAALLLTAMGIKLIPDSLKSRFRANDIKNKESYLVSDEIAIKKATDVVAVINGKKLTNGSLQIYYKLVVQEFLSYNSSDLDASDLDTTKPFSEQTCTLDEALTWEQYFLKLALESWQNYQTIAVLAEESGYTLSEEAQAELDALPELLEEEAKSYEYESAQKMIEDILGVNCKMQDYVEYVKLEVIINEFYAGESERLMPTDEETEAYFDENVDTFEYAGITKDGGLISSVRHILICPEGGEFNPETYETTYSDAEWAAAKKKAEKLLKEWKKGEATEESFAALVADNTEDTASIETGGLYENITPISSYVEEFLEWSVDMNRKTGDTGIVKTVYGYHIMYFVDGEPYWLNEARILLLSERTDNVIAEAEAKWPMEVNYRNIALTDLKLY